MVTGAPALFQTSSYFEIRRFDAPHAALLVLLGGWVRTFGWVTLSDLSLDDDPRVTPCTQCSGTCNVDIFVD
jgi:hypothetical protein